MRLILLALAAFALLKNGHGLPLGEGTAIVSSTPDTLANLAEVLDRAVEKLR